MIFFLFLSLSVHFLSSYAREICLHLTFNRMQLTKRNTVETKIKRERNRDRERKKKQTTIIQRNEAAHSIEMH